MATKEQVLASIADGSIFKSAESNRTARLKVERINQIADSAIKTFLFVGPPKPINHLSGNGNAGAADWYNRGSTVRYGD